MKRVRETLTYPGANVDQIFAMLGDPAFRKAVAERQRVTDFACDITPDGAGMRVRMEQAHPTDRVPSFARKLVGDEIRFVQDEQWSSHSSASYAVSIPGKPGDITGTVTLSQHGPDVQEVVDIEVRVGIPLVGGKLEGLVADYIGGSVRAENAVGLEWLAGERS